MGGSFVNPALTWKLSSYCQQSMHTMDFSENLPVSTLGGPEMILICRVNSSHYVCSMNGLRSTKPHRSCAPDS